MPYQVQYALRSGPRETKLWVEDTGRWFAGGDGKPGRAHGVVRVITDRYEREQHLTYLSRFDVLTGEFNRWHLTERLSRTLEEAEYRPFWKAVEQLGAVVFFHQGGETLVTPRSARYHLPNSIGNLVDRAVTFATLVHGGVLDAHPDLKIVLGHGGGYTCYGIGRMDHAWQVRSEARVHVSQPPSAYLRRFYYDCIVYTEPALRYLIDTVGVDRVVFGTDWPYDMALDWPVAWILGMTSLSQAEKDAILWRNLERLLGI